MKSLKVRNPFNAPVYHEETVDSTMNISRALASNGEPHGTVITADFQDAGRGRVQGRKWRMDREKNLPLTIILRYTHIEEMPAALTLRAGLAVSLAIEDFEPRLQNKIKIKWTNDIMIGSKKAAGILCEADCHHSNGSATVHLGIGVNFAQKDFPGELSEKATSIAVAAEKDFPPNERFQLLENILTRLHSELQTEAGDSWKQRVEQRLYKKGEQVIFIEGASWLPQTSVASVEISGSLAGIGEGGELLIVPNGETTPRSFITGELKVY